MKKILFILAILAINTQLQAQSNAPVRLALISEGEPAATAADVLTAQLSGNQRIQLLERDQIAKVYREQGLSKANTDYLKLGQILGADGLLLLQTVTEGTNQFLNARLVAVKPGVVLAAEKFSWPVKDMTEWSASFVGHLDSFLPKLSVLVKDAIPISVVNLRSAIQSDEGKETERQLKLLTIQRLSREPQLFVLERQKMQLLTEEKELKLDDSAFWNGSYLLEGVVDQNGYSQETITINARLTPPKGGAPLQFEVRGARTNLAQVINQLATKVNEALKVSSTVKEWNSADEAAQYFDEAKWALRWGVLPEAQAAADSAWALGKQDMDCAIIRIKAYMLEVLTEAGGFQAGVSAFGDGFDDAFVQSKVKALSAQHPYGLIYKIQQVADMKVVNYVFASGLPDPKNIDRALHALDLYFEFSRTSPDGEPKILSRGKGWNDWHNSDWYLLGIDDLVAASRVLQNFNFVPESQKPVANRLAELRALARSVAELISKSPSVRDSYFVGDRVAVYDELAITIGEDGGRNPNIFSCEAKWGCFWQETPQDCVALYRELMSSPVFCYIHDKIWFRTLQRPRLVAWTEDDRKRLATVWGDFMRETDASTNVFMLMEGKALKLRDANDEKEAAIAATNFFAALLENRCAFVTNNVDVFYLNWHIDDLVQSIGGYKDDFGGGIERFGSPTPETVALWSFCSDFSAKLNAKDVECKKCLADLHNLQAFERQRQYLKDNKPFDPQEFVQLFISGFKDYSETQALEIKPLLAAYKTNLTGTWARIGAMQVAQVEANVNRILNPPAPSPQPPIRPPAPKPAIVAQTAVVPPVSNNAPKTPPLEKTPEIATNVLLVKNYLKIPQEQIGVEDITRFTFLAHRWSAGKLLLDLRFHGLNRAAVGVFDPQTGRWEMINCPKEYFGNKTVGMFNADRSGLCFELFQGNLYFSDKRFDFKTRQWTALNVPGLANSRLFNIGGRLYAATRESIFEITGDGKSTHVLASTRRRPAASVLDSMDNLGSPQLFSCPNHLLCSNFGQKIYGWDGGDWHEILTLGFDQPLEIFEEAVIFRSVPTFGSGDPANLWIWPKDQSAPELWIHDKPKPHPQTDLGLNRPDKQTVRPLWKSPDGDYLASSAATFFKSNLYFFVDHCIVTNVSGSWTAVENNGYHAKLVCLSRDFPDPIVVPLKFDSSLGQPPLESLGEKFSDAPWMTAPTWMYFSGDKLFIGQADSLGIWTIPISVVEAAVTTQKQMLIARQAREKQTAERDRKMLMAKYDLNHNGVWDPEEKVKAWDDPAFWAVEIDNIDTNHNGFLDPEELGYFKAHGDLDLARKVGGAIKAVQQLLADRLFTAIDSNHDGKVDYNEFAAFAADHGVSLNASLVSEFGRWDINRDRQIDPQELRLFLEELTSREQSQNQPRAVPPNLPQPISR